MPSKKKSGGEKKGLCAVHVVSSLPFSGCMHAGILGLLSPQGTSLKSFSVNFHPLPNSDEPFLPPTPQWRICPRSLCPPLTSFFDCSLSFRQHAAYANTRSFIHRTPPLNECNLKWGHTHLQKRGMETRTHNTWFVCCCFFLTLCCLSIADINRKDTV